VRLYFIVKGAKLIGIVWAVTPEQATKYALDNHGAEAVASLVPQVGGVG
jgi:hypothetical protein